MTKITRSFKRSHFRLLLLFFAFIMNFAAMNADSKEKNRIMLDYEKGPVGKLVWRLAIPAMFAQFGNILYTVTDRIFVGNIPVSGQEWLASIGLCAPILAMLTGIAALVGVGGATVMNLYRGKKNGQMAQAVVANSFILLLLLAVLGMLILLPFKRTLLYAFGASAVLYPYANAYFSIYLCGTVFSLLSLGMNYFIQGQGFAKQGMFAVMLGALLNLLLDPLFIFVFHWQGQGAAFATVLAQVISCIYVLTFMLKKADIRIIKMRPCLAIWWDILKIGALPFLMVFLDNFVMVAMNASLQKYGGAMGDTYLAVMAVVQSFFMIATMPQNGIVDGTQGLISYNYGAGQKERVRQILLFVFYLCGAYCLLMILCAFGGGFAFAHLFDQDPVYCALVARAIRIYFIGFLGVAVQYTLVDGLSAMGLIRYAIPLSLFRKFVFLLSILLLPHFFPAETLFFAEPVSDIIGASFTLFCFFVLIPWHYKRKGQDCAY